MKRLGVATAAILAIALTTAPAFADDKSKGKSDDKGKARQSVELVGAIASVVDTSTVTVTIKGAAESKTLRSLTKSMKDATVTVKADTNTVVKKAGATVALGSLLVGDRVNVRATCVAGSPIVCTASRVTAVAAPAPKPLQLGLTLRGVVVSNTSGTLGVVATNVEAGKDNTFKENALKGLTVSVLTDSSTVVTKAGATQTVASLTAFPAVTVTATCTQATPAVCTAKRITVIVPTS